MTERSPPKSAPEHTEGPTTPLAFAHFRAGLLAMVALVTLSLTAVTAVDIVRDRDRIRQDAERQVQNLAKTLELHAQGVFRTADLAAATLAEALTLRPSTLPLNDDEVLRLMERLLAGGGALRTLAVADADGRVRVASGELAKGLDVADRAWFRIHKETPDRGSFISPPFQGTPAQGRILGVSRRIADQAGDFVGAAWAVIDPGQLEGFYASLDIGASGSVGLWSSEGLILIRHPQQPEALGGGSPLADTIREHVGEKREGLLFGPSPVDGVPGVAAFRAVEGLPLYVSVRVAERDYLAAWYRTASQQALETGINVLVVVVLTLLLLRYLRRLEGTARALQDSERRARAIFDSTFQYMALLTPDGTLLAVNRAGLEFGGAGRSGRSRARIAGRPVWTLRAWRNMPESAERMRRSVEQAAAGALVRFEADLEAGDDRHTMDCSVKPVRDSSGRVVLLVAEARDITERKRMEDSLRQSRARLRSYLDAAMEGIAVSDGNGRYVDVNPAACQMLGYTRDEMLSLNISEIIVEEGGDEPCGHCFSTLLETGEFRGEATMRRKDGSLRLAEINAVRLDDDRYLGVIRDVTERHHAEKALRTSTARLEALVQALPDLAFIIDAEGRYRELLASRAELMAAPAEALMGRPLAEVLPPSATPPLLAAIGRTLETGEPQTVEYRLTVPAGRRWFEGRTAVLPAGFAPEPMVLLLVRDATERVLSAQRLALAKEQAESANRIKSNFLATMSHELRTPLNAIIGFSEMMVHRVFGPVGNARYADYAGHIQRSGAHLLDLINDVLDMSKLEAGRYTLEEHEIRLAEVLDSCLALNAVPAENSGVALVSETSPSLPMLRGDERAVRQVVLNLLSNAVKFTQSGGRVTLSAGVAADRALEVRVADTGIGIEPAALAHITEPFQQADNSISRRFGGTGLGLAISRNLMELHGGTLDIESTLGEGTTVTIRFPAERVVRPAEAIQSA